MEEVKPRIWTLTGHRAARQFSVELGLYQNFDEVYFLSIIIVESRGAHYVTDFDE